MKKMSWFSGFNEELMKNGADAAADFALKMGFSGVEFFDVARKGEELIPGVKFAGEVGRAMRDRGLEIPCYSCYGNLWKDDAEDLLKQRIDCAAATGTRQFHHTLLPYLTNVENAPSFEKAMEIVADRAARVADYAKTMGITCLYEDQGVYFNGVYGFGEIWKQLRSRCTNVGICADFGNVMFVGERPEPFIRKFAGDIRHVHVKDYLFKNSVVPMGKFWLEIVTGGWARDTVIGDGVLNIPACMSLLRDQGYDGWYSLEFASPERFEDGLREGIAYLDRLCEALDRGERFA